MKGLIIKDLMCLRKQRVTFCFTVLSVIVISVMFVLSAKFGNIASANQEMMAANGMSDIDIKNLSTIALILFMLLPIAMVGDVSTVIVADGKAGFANVSSILPISIKKRVLAKFITIISMFGMRDFKTVRTMAGYRRMFCSVYTPVIAFKYKKNT